MKLNDYKEAINNLSTMIKRFPKADNVKNAYLHIGIAFEMANVPDKAISYYNKVVSMEPKDSITKIALKNIKAIDNKR